MNIRLCLNSRLFAEALRDKIARCNSAYKIAVNDDPFPILTSTDLFLTDGSKHCLALREQHPEARFILVDPGYDDDEVTFLLLGYHFDGVFCPDFDPALLDRALKAVFEGQFWLEQRHLKGLMCAQRTREHAGLMHLTAKERRIVEMVSRGLRNREIADQLCLCEQTIKSNVSKIYRKLNISNRSQLVRLVLSAPAPSPH